MTNSARALSAKSTPFREDPRPRAGRGSWGTMPDPLYDAIARALEKPLRGDLFERCALDLLRMYYPTLRPVEGLGTRRTGGWGGAADT